MDVDIWKAFLSRWSEEMLEVDDIAKKLALDVVVSGWLGYPGATEEQIVAAERRLGIVRFPASYRTFLQVSNGWRNVGFFIDNLWSTEEVEWLRVRNQDLIDIWMEVEQERRSENPETVPFYEAVYLPDAIEVSDWGDSAILMLNPSLTNANEEWEACAFANWASPCATGYPSFWEMMQSEYRSFLDVRAANYEKRNGRYYSKY